MAYPPPGPGSGYPPAGGYPPSGGYPPPPGGQPGGYPPAPGSYPPAPQAGGYPAQPGYGSYPPPAGGGQPYTPPGAAGAPGGYGPPPQAAPGFTVPPAQPGYGAPPAQPGYGAPPAQPGYGAPPPQPGYGQPPGGYPAQPPAGGYPGQAPPGYGAQQPPPPGAGYGTAPPGYPQQQAPPGAPQQAPAPSAAPARPPPPGAPGAPSATAAMSNLSLGGQAYGHPTIRPAVPFDAEQACEKLRKAMRGVGTDEKAIIDLVASYDNAQRVEIRKRFKTMYGKDLINDLKSELSGNLEECILALFDPASVYDAQQLRRAMKGAGTDEETIIDILCTRTNAEIQQIKQAYKTIYQRDLEKDCVSETSGHFKRLLVSMCQANRDESTTVDMAKAQKEAQDLYQAGEKKWGTDESRFNVVLASRSFPQLRATYTEYTKISQRDILNSIDREMSGDLKHGFKAIVMCSRNPADYFAERLWKSMKGAGTNDSLLIRIVVSRSEIDLVEIKTAFLNRYHKTLYKMVEGDCSGDYKKILYAIIGTG